MCVFARLGDITWPWMDSFTPMRMDETEKTAALLFSDLFALYFTLLSNSRTSTNVAMLWLKWFSSQNIVDSLPFGVGLRVSPLSSAARVLMRVLCFRSCCVMVDG